MTCGNSRIEILFLSQLEVESVLDPIDGVSAAEQAYKALGENQIAHHHIVTPMNEKGTNIYNAMPTIVRSLQQAGIKWASVYMERKPGDNLPLACCSLVILNNPENAVPYAIMSGVPITNMRTAGGHAVVAAKYLAKKNSKTLAILGCGSEGRTGLRGFDAVFSLEQVNVYDKFPAATTAFVKDMSNKTAAKIVPKNTVEEAVKGVDMILLVTSSQEVVLKESWVEKGCFVAGMTSFADLDPVLSVKADKWVLGTREGDGYMIIDGHGGLPVPEELSRDNVYADMGEIVTGKKVGRENDQERILYSHLGMGPHDIILGNIAYKKAIEQGIGTKIYL